MITEPVRPVSRLGAVDPDHQIPVCQHLRRRTGLLSGDESGGLIKGDTSSGFISGDESGYFISDDSSSVFCIHLNILGD